MRIIRADTTDHFLGIETLARRIVPDFYATYFDVAAAKWMVENGHTAAALQEQARQGYRHYLLEDGGEGKGEKGGEGEGEGKGAYVGYFALHTEGRLMRLSHFYVLEEVRGKGYGQLAMDFIQREAEASKVEAVELLVLRRNKATVGFYRKNGYFPVAEVLTRLGNGAVLEDYLMRKEIGR